MKKEQIRKIREEGMKKPGKMMEDMKTNSRLLFEKGRTNQPSNIIKIKNWMRSMNGEIQL